MGAAERFPGFFSEESLGLTGGCWPTLLNLWFEGEEPSRSGRPECPLLQLGDVVGKRLSFLQGSSEDFTSGTLEFTSPSSAPFSVMALPIELKVLDEVATGSSQDVSLCAGGWSEEDRPESKVFLEELKDVRGRGIELLFGSPFFSGDTKSGTEEEFGFAFALLFVSSIFVEGNCWFPMSCLVGYPI